MNSKKRKNSDDDTNIDNSTDSSAPSTSSGSGSKTKKISNVSNSESELGSFHEDIGQDFEDSGSEYQPNDTDNEMMRRDQVENELFFEIHNLPNGINVSEIGSMGISTNEIANEDMDTSISLSNATSSTINASDALDDVEITNTTDITTKRFGRKDAGNDEHCG